MFYHRILSPPSPIHTQNEEDKEKCDKLDNPLLVTSDRVGIDITTNDLIMNNISFPCQKQESRHTPEYTTKGMSEKVGKPKNRASPASATVTSHSVRSVWEKSIDDMLSQAKADSYSQEMHSNSSLTEVSHQWTSTHLYEYNHGHDSYSPNRPEMSPSHSYRSGRSSTPDTTNPIAVYHTRARFTPHTPEHEANSLIPVETTQEMPKRQMIPKIMPPLQITKLTNKVFHHRLSYREHRQLIHTGRFATSPQLDQTKCAQCMRKYKLT